MYDEIHEHRMIVIESAAWEIEDFLLFLKPKVSLTNDRPSKR